MNKDNLYTWKLWLKNMIFYGMICLHCFSRKDLEFAHTKITKLNGNGRGKRKRMLDIMRNNDKYILICKKCHNKFHYDFPISFNNFK